MNENCKIEVRKNGSVWMTYLAKMPTVPEPVKEREPRPPTQPFYGGSGMSGYGIRELQNSPEAIEMRREFAESF